MRAVGFESINCMETAYSSLGLHRLQAALTEGAGCLLQLPRFLAGRLFDAVTGEKRLHELGDGADRLGGGGETIAIADRVAKRDQRLRPKAGFASRGGRRGMARRLKRRLEWVNG